MLGIKEVTEHRHLYEGSRESYIFFAISSLNLFKAFVDPHSILFRSNKMSAFFLDYFDLCFMLYLW